MPRFPYRRSVESDLEDLWAYVRRAAPVITAMESRLAALENPPTPTPTNLVANPAPSIDQGIGNNGAAQWAASGWWADGDNPTMWTYEVGGVVYCSGPVAPYSSVVVWPLETEYTTTVSPYAPTLGVDVSPSGGYEASVYVQSYLKENVATVNARIGIVWYDSGGVEISTSWGAAVATADDAFPWHDGDTLEPWTGWSQARPTVTAAAPAGAVTGRPVVEVDHPNHVIGAVEYWVSMFEMYGPL